LRLGITAHGGGVLCYSEGMKNTDIRARLTIYGMGEMDKKQYAHLRKWIMGVATEMKTEKQEIYSKHFRATLYKEEYGKS
jgi:hypothetical protein